ncbi:uncharacterized protein MELLADRAFT_63532 [Melampsora larici-populina 98AG31]|uniref:Uncharacterized protein n=1 Tax=Melampsora larici-populina (strain 98AG31 / pathotype 3-4-7) TaxID=747676 RepID=F4RMZ7_MELLP|nr:uncharacterized protein MELLADRAFT_63532 [Melampsora larici-populina 98AG31]EGG06208.1 hypothetical protein MELLADRAFT_63532 [Melampsora larici-populina 98AG31]
MLSNPYKTSPNHSKSVKKWARAVREHNTRGTLSKFEMNHVQSLVCRHLRVLMCRESESSPIPPSLSEQEMKALLENFPVGEPLPHGSSPALLSSTDFANTGIHLKAEAFAEIEQDLMCWGLRRFSFNWKSDTEDRVNKLACKVFWNSFYRATQAHSYKFSISCHLLRRDIAIPVFVEEFNRLAVKYQKQCESPAVLEYHNMVAKKKQACNEYRTYLVKSHADPGLSSIFQPRNYAIMGDILEVRVTVGMHSITDLHFEIPRWWSEKTICFMELLETKVHRHANARNDFPGSIRPSHEYIQSSSTEYGFIPHHLPADMYSHEFKASLLPAEYAEIKMKHSILPDLEMMSAIFPPCESAFFEQPSDNLLNNYYTSDDDVTSSELDNSDTQTIPDSPTDNLTGLDDDENGVKTQLETLSSDLQSSIASFTAFQNEIQTSMPMRLEQLQKSQDNISHLNSKLEALQGELGSLETALSLGTMAENVTSVDS